MRIISGAHRGQRLQTLKGNKLRPTSDQMRETLFDVLGPGIAGLRFLDAYAGSGAVGIEALSRGVSDVVFIEHNRAANEMIRKNLAALNIQAGFRLLSCKVLAGIEKLNDEGRPFDFLFLDPPYSEITEYHHALRQLGRSRLLQPASLVIAEHSRHYFLEEKYGRLVCMRVIQHGDTQLAFYRLAE
jgi:16S rRNA (guanine966-N2)-methyltransferase